MGAITQPRVVVVTPRGMWAPEFMNFAEPGFTKIAWNIAVRPEAAGGAVGSTETRVAATDAPSRRRFQRHWFVFSPGIRLIRRVALARLRRELRRGRGSPAA